ncbi:ABC-F family ATP-binding cassette domain-containing protein [Pseudaquidulcibacter saccharophilus]|uniref:ABC-F family ATP-binding cassette domain-containing protein n=1 Tax=Pseudaquidulcibacter saccharophilus TaxID=2831900 RepID=UPI001EFF25A5|nr:ABC-F family ATP-binding cassette domain-containing protein [Pseudaquidulcibacter saccharophilus]
MLEITELSHAFGKRILFDNASAFIADGWKVGVIGKNGTGKSTLLKLIREEVGKPNSPIKLKRGARMGFVAQEVPANETPMMEMVLEQDLERHALMTEAETATDPDRIGYIHSRLLDIDAYSAEARAAEIMVGLGFKQDDLYKPAGEFSGGWRMRAALAGVLVSQPDLLILDEPTNYLDLEGAAWLESYLVKYPHTVLVVSHDREVLNRSVTHVLALENQKLEISTGGYDIYLKRRAERMANLTGQKAKQDAAKAHLQAFVDRFRAKASKARQAQARIKMMEKMQDIQVPIEDRAMPFHFYDAPELASPLIQLEDADLGYIKGQPVLKNVNFRLDNEDRIVIIGPNGQGKTTLVKSIGERLKLLNGERRASNKIKIGYFSQDSMDELREGDTVLQHIKDLEPEAGESKHRAIAANIGFGQDKIGTKVEKLSGGEKVRLLLGITAYARPHILILDEPTSHLDIDSREALIHALNDFSGAILLITHDVYLAEACADSLWLVFNGRASQYDGDLSDYRQMVLTADRPDSKPAKDGKEKWGKPKAGNNQIQTLKRKIAACEKDIAIEQDKIAQIENQLADPGSYNKDHHAAMDLTKTQNWHQKRLDKFEAEYLEALEKLEDLES